jgi:two-component system, chemotaxis family, CheB/CheR fusion protein
MTEINPKKPVLSDTENFPIAGIGASAGGLEALEHFFSNMSPDSGIAFVVIQHLDPNHKGMLTELLQRYTVMNVVTATNRMKVKPDSIYVIPPNRSMSVVNGILHLSEPVESHGLRLPIDYFFRSLADDRQEKSIGIILSGMGSDGSNGVRAIKEKGGMVLIQDPDSARFNSMPLSAIEAVIPDVIVPANELPEKLMMITRQFPGLVTGSETEKETSSLEKIILILRSQTGNDFSQYKKTTMYRRIERRMSIHQINKIGLYVTYLQENPYEVDILFKELLIGVTSFFRDELVWERLRDEVIPSLLERLPDRHTIRIWIPACSTGEEAYSLAIVFKEVLRKINSGKILTIQIFATDINSSSIEKARKGIYPSNIVTDVTPGRLDLFFTKSDEQFHINPEVREMVVFAPQNLVRDPPFTKLDIIFCRNLLIYFDLELQKKVLSIFHYSLRKDGILVLGTAETNSSHPDLFSAADTKYKIYTRSDSAVPDDPIEFSYQIFRTGPFANEKNKIMNLPESIQTLTDQLLLQKYSPASVLVTDKGDILYITGSTGKYLEPAAGKANMNLFAMAREGLRNELYIGFRKAMHNFEKVILHNIIINDEMVNHVAEVTIQQIEKPPALKGKIIVVFKDVADVNQKKISGLQGKHSGLELNQELEIELMHVKEDLQAAREEMLTSQEELKSANEELQSTNEELQSTNEELTTSKEEMQSLNEELHTVNSELQSKIDDFSRVNNDMNNLLNSIEIATLFLDKELKIRQFTYPATKLFKLIQTDIGRLFTDQVTDLDYPDMQQDAREVLRTLAFLERKISTRDNRWFKIRIMPYITLEDRLEGLVITFIDITKSQHLEDALLESQTILRSLVHTVPDIIISLSSDGKIVEFNPEAEKLLGVKRQEVVDQKFIDIFVPEASRQTTDDDLKKLLSGTMQNRILNDIITASGNKYRIEWTAHKLINSRGEQTGIIAIGSKVSNP